MSGHCDSAMSAHDPSTEPTADAFTVVVSDHDYLGGETGTPFGTQMAIHDFHSSGQLQSRQWRFHRYVLDLDSGCLLFEGNEIAFGPRPSRVHEYLIEHAGRLVSKDELFEAVWPGIAVWTTRSCKVSGSAASVFR